MRLWPAGERILSPFFLCLLFAVVGVVPVALLTGSPLRIIGAGGLVASVATWEAEWLSPVTRLEERYATSAFVIRRLEWRERRLDFVAPVPAKDHGRRPILGLRRRGRGSHRANSWVVRCRGSRQSPLRATARRSRPVLCTELHSPGGVRWRKGPPARDPLVGRAGADNLTADSRGDNGGNLRKAVSPNREGGRSQRVVD